MSRSPHPPCHDQANAIEFDAVSRSFVIRHERTESFQDWFLQLFKRGPEENEEFWALRDVTFAVRRGETVGIVGRNGAGKSTMLKLVTGILEPSRGQVRATGRLYAMLELGAGFHPELSGKDNIYLNGSIYGFGRKSMRRKYERIVEFAELKQFIDIPVKYYSSGMFVRLGFATAIHMDPGILVVDEVLAVGDAAFRRKCHDAIRDLQRQGVTILLVSHDSEEVREFCDRVVLLSEGRVIAHGPVEEALTDYARLQLSEQDRAALTSSTPAPGSDHAQARIASIVLRDAAGEPTRQARHATPLTVDLLLIGETRSPLTIQLRCRTPLGVLLFESWDLVEPAADTAQRRVECYFPMFPLLNGEALIEVALYDHAKEIIIDTAEAHLTLEGTTGPLFQFEHQWRHPDAAASPLALHENATPDLLSSRRP